MGITPLTIAVFESLEAEETRQTFSHPFLFLKYSFSVSSIVLFQLQRLLFDDLYRDNHSIFTLVRIFFCFMSSRIISFSPRFDDTLVAGEIYLFSSFSYDDDDDGVLPVIIIEN